MKRYLQLLSFLLGYGIIIAGFCLLGQSLESEIRVLDIIVSIVLFTYCGYFLLRPLIDLGDRAQKGVGMLGIKLMTMNIVGCLSIAVMVLGAIYEMAFKYQLFSQCVVLFILVGGVMSALHVGEKVQRVHEKEETLVTNKIMLKDCMDSLMDNVIDMNVTPEIKERLNSINESLRFVSPSNKMEAVKLDTDFINQVSTLQIMLRSTSDLESLKMEVTKLEQILNKRKRY